MIAIIGDSYCLFRAIAHCLYGARGEAPTVYVYEI